MPAGERPALQHAGERPALRGTDVKLGAFIAGVFGTVGFAVSIVAGVMSDNAMESILIRGVLCAVLCYVVGYFVGLMAQQVAAEQAKRIMETVAAEDDRRAADEREEQAQSEADAAANARPTEPAAAAATASGNAAKT